MMSHIKLVVDWLTIDMLSLKQLANTLSVFYNDDRSLIQLILHLPLQYLHAIAFMRAERPPTYCQPIRRYSNAI